jgi:hypothetical protein
VRRPSAALESLRAPARFDTFRHTPALHNQRFAKRIAPATRDPFDTFRHPTPNKINTLRNEIPHPRRPTRTDLRSARASRPRSVLNRHSAKLDRQTATVPAAQPTALRATTTSCCPSGTTQ